MGHRTCMAGLAETYSHVGALLHWVENAVRMAKEVSCTSCPNEWIVPRVHTNSAIAVAEPAKEERRTFFETISKGSQQPTLQ